MVVEASRVLQIIHEVLKLNQNSLEHPRVMKMCNNSRRYHNLLKGSTRFQNYPEGYRIDQNFLEHQGLLIHTSILQTSLEPPLLCKNSQGACQNILGQVLFYIILEYSKDSPWLINRGMPLIFHPSSKVLQIPQPTTSSVFT